MAMNGWPVVLGDLVNRADVRMVERGRGARFAPEPFDVAVRRARHLRRQELQRDLAAERQIFGEIDDAHPAAAEQRLDSVVADYVARIHAIRVPT